MLISKRSISPALITLGFAISVYLLWKYVVIVGIWPPAGENAFFGFFGPGCDAMLRNPVSVQLGIPLAGWGLIYYSSLAIFLLFGRIFGDEFDSEANLGALLLSLKGLVISIALSGMLLIGSAPFCSLCFIVSLINLALVISLWRQTGMTIDRMIDSIRAGAGYLITGKTADQAQARWKLLGFFTIALVAVVLYQWLLIETVPGFSSAGHSIDHQQILTTFENAAEQIIEVGPDDPTLGPSNAPFQIVVFSDFKCPACKSYAGDLHTLFKQSENNLRIVFKHFPLDKACNPLIKSDFHPGACQSAFAAEAARRQGKFWEFHDALFSAEIQPREANDYRSFVNDLGLDWSRFQADSIDDEIAAKVRSDIEQGIRLRINATPTVFLNRRILPDPGINSIRVLTAHLLNPGNE